MSTGFCTCLVSQPAAKIGFANFHTPMCGIHGGGCPLVGKSPYGKPTGLFFANWSPAASIQQAVAFAKGLTPAVAL